MRKIDISGEIPVTPKEQALPEILWIAIDLLVVDDRYQRPLGVSNWRRIRAIAADFRWSRFAPLLVARLPDGTFAVVDGQHRVHAALLCGFTHVPVLVAEMDDREQARSFSWVNDQVTRISPFHIFKAALAAGETWAIDCRSAVEDAGCRLMTSNASTATKRSGEIFAIHLIREMVASGHQQGVTAALRSLRKYDHTNARVALYSAIILRPWITAVSEREEFLTVDLVGFLKKNDPYQVLDRLERIRRKDGLTGKTPATLERKAFVMLLDAWSDQKTSAAA